MEIATFKIRPSLDLELCGPMPEVQSAKNLITPLPHAWRHYYQLTCIPDETG